VPALTACLLCLALIPAARVQAATDQAGTFVEKAEADIRINLDGTVDIVESITFHFQHKKTALPFDLIFPLEGEPHLEMLELAREEGADQGKYIPIPRQDKLRPQPLSYSTVRKRDRIRAVVDSTGLQGRCTFRITYQWNRGVILKEGRAIVSGPLLAVRPDTRIETMKWTLHFPEGIRMDLSQITPVSIRAMTMKKTSERTISYIDNQTFYKIDGIALIISMPGNSFPLIFPASDKTSLSSLFEKADRQSWQLSRLGMLRLSLIRVVVPLAAAGLLIYVTLYLIQIMGLGLPGRNFARWPVSEAPALVAKLARIHPRDSLLLLGTLLQLINRKEVLWRDEIFSWRKPGRNDFSGFTAWEIVLLQWLFAGHESYDHTLAPERLRLAARDPDFRELATRFRAQIDKEFNHSGLKNLKLTSSFRLFFIVFAALFFVLSGLLFLITHAATAFLLLIPALFFALGGITFRFLTGKGVRRYLETRRFMRKLASPQMIIDSCAGRLNEAETVISTLPAAIALKKRKAFFKGLRALPRPLFMRASYALLHVYRQLPVPGEDKLATISSDDEFERLRLKIEEMERILSAWEEFFDSCFI
jgi:hypothetical protein